MSRSLKERCPCDCCANRSTRRSRLKPTRGVPAAPHHVPPGPGPPRLAPTGPSPARTPRVGNRSRQAFSPPGSLAAVLPGALRPCRTAPACRGRCRRFPQEACHWLLLRQDGEPVGTPGDPAGRGRGPLDLAGRRCFSRRRCSTGFRSVRPREDAASPAGAAGRRPARRRRRARPAASGRGAR
jgi:hypothetical protein